MSAYVIGLTGGISTGKSNLSSALKKAGAKIIDADEISRSLTAPGGEALPLIRKEFGDRVFDGENLNRRALGEMVFGHEENRKKLNAIVHPMVFAKMRAEIAASDGPVIMDVPLLFECGMDAWCDEIWCAYVPQKIQAKRLMERDRLTYRQAMNRIHSQMPTLEKARRADRVIRTTGSREESVAIVLSMWQETLKKFQPEK
ncbi:MAG: dephospho-CoA kinase [Clostridiales bacterium]|nr:dephospho-CoA kinase [Clostridiales bacterium]